MCGIIGAAGSLTKNVRDAVKDLLIMDSIRGPHSTGIFVLDDFGKTAIHKKAVGPLDFLDMKKVDQTFLSNNNRIIIGHNRWATKGAINSINAHPFQQGSIFGVHNGTLRVQSYLPDYLDFEVDSENIMHSLNISTVEETVSKLHGAYALNWWDDTTKRLHFLRNDERSLHHCYSEDLKTLFWASEPYMLAAALCRNGIKFTKIEPFEEDTLYTFDVKLIQRIAPVFDKPYVKKLEGPAPYLPPVPAYYRGVGNVVTNIKAKKNKASMAGGAGDTPAYLTELGYSLTAVVPIFLSSHKGTIVHGETLDGTNTAVRVHVGDEKAAEALVAYEGWYSASGLTGFKKPTVHGEGYISIGRTALTKKTWENFTEGKKSLGSSTDTVAVIDMDGSTITKIEFARRFKDGCIVCSNPVVYDVQDFEIVGKRSVICTDCRDIPFVTEARGNV